MSLGKWVVVVEGDDEYIRHPRSNPGDRAPSDVGSAVEEEDVGLQRLRRGDKVIVEPPEAGAEQVLVLRLSPWPQNNFERRRSAGKVPVPCKSMHAMPKALKRISDRLLMHVGSPVASNQDLHDRTL